MRNLAIVVVIFAVWLYASTAASIPVFAGGVLIGILGRPRGA